jgi:hypothetical protein
MLRKTTPGVSLFKAHDVEKGCTNTGASSRVQCLEPAARERLELFQGGESHPTLHLASSEPLQSTTTSHHAENDALNAAVRGVVQCEEISKLRARKCSWFQLI